MIIMFVLVVLMIMIVFDSEAKGELGNPSMTLRVAVGFEEIVGDCLVEAIV